jgi:hypothetical protein
MAHLRPAWLNDTPIPSPFPRPHPKPKTVRPLQQYPITEEKQSRHASLAPCPFTAPGEWGSSHCPGLAQPCQGAPSAPSGSSCPGQRAHSRPGAASACECSPARRVMRLAALCGLCGAPVERRPRGRCRPAGGRARAGGGGARLAALQVRDVQHLLHVRAAHRALAVVPPQLLRRGGARLSVAAHPLGTPHAGAGGCRPAGLPAGRPTPAHTPAHKTRACFHSIFRVRVAFR